MDNNNVRNKKNKYIIIKYKIIKININLKK